MSYTREGDTVRLEMSIEDWENVLLMLGVAVGAIHREDKPGFYRWLALVNRLNEGNPNFRPYEIPEEYRAVTT